MRKRARILKKSSIISIIFLILFILLLTTVYINEILKINSKISGKVISENEIALDGCTELNQSGRYVLNQDIIGSWINSPDCFSITSSNIELDCKGYNIINVNSYLASIYVSDANNIIIRNCNISVKPGSSDYIYGIFLNNAPNTLITGNTISNANTGIELDSSSKATIFNNKLVSNSIGIALAASSDNNISKNTGISNNAAIYTQLTSNNNYIADNILFGGSGIILDETSSGNHLINNEISEITEWGISLTSSSNNNILGNILSSGNNIGILLQKNSNNNYFSDNVIDSIPIAINLTKSSNNRIENSIISSSQYDVVLYDNSLNNIIVNSSFDSNKEFVQSGQLIRKWYLDIFVSDGNKSLDKVSIRITNSSSNLIYFLTTDSKGFARQELAEYSDNNKKSYFSNYTLVLTKEGYNGKYASILMTGNKNLSFIFSIFNSSLPSPINNSIENMTADNQYTNLNENPAENKSGEDQTEKNMSQDSDNFMTYSSREKYGCTPKIECNDWGKCRGNYDLASITENVIFLKGKRSRACIDKNDCLFNIVEFQKCEDRIPIVIVKGSGCYQGYIKIFDLDNNLISLLDIKESNNSLNINLVLDNSDYCPYCYDGIKDYDEEEIDCGGSCTGCSNKLYSSYDFFNLWNIILIFITASIVFLCLVSFIKYFKSRHQISSFKQSYSED